MMVIEILFRFIEVALFFVACAVFFFLWMNRRHAKFEAESYEEHFDLDTRIHRQYRQPHAQTEKSPEQALRAYQVRNKPRPEAQRAQAKPRSKNAKLQNSAE